MTPAEWKEKTKDIPFPKWERAIRRWARKYNHIERKAINRGPKTALMTEAEARREKKRYKKDLYAVPVLEWIELPTRLPYRRGDPQRDENPELIYYDPSFLSLVKR